MLVLQKVHQRNCRYSQATLCSAPELLTSAILYQKVLLCYERRHTGCNKILQPFHKYLFMSRSCFTQVDLRNPRKANEIWLPQLQEYEFKIEHKSGIYISDCKHCSKLGRKFLIQSRSARRTVLWSDHYWVPKVLAKEQRDDDDIGPIYKVKKNGTSMSDIKVISHLSPEVKA